MKYSLYAVLKDNQLGKYVLVPIPVDEPQYACDGISVEFIGNIEVYDKKFFDKLVLKD